MQYNIDSMTFCLYSVVEKHKRVAKLLAITITETTAFFVPSFLIKLTATCSAFLIHK